MVASVFGVASVASVSGACVLRTLLLLRAPLVVLRGRATNGAQRRSAALTSLPACLRRRLPPPPPPPLPPLLLLLLLLLLPSVPSLLLPSVPDNNRRSVNFNQALTQYAM
jgi:hypothetical protein